MVDEAAAERLVRGLTEEFGGQAVSSTVIQRATDIGRRDRSEP